MNETTLSNPESYALPFLIIPADGEEFELTLNGDAVDPIEMVRSIGHKKLRIGWRFNGPNLTGTHRGIFKLCRAHSLWPPSDSYNSPTIENIKRSLPRGNFLAEGQWCAAFLRKYTRSDGKGPIGFAGSEWRWKPILESSRSMFPYLTDNGGAWGSGFIEVEKNIVFRKTCFDNDWRFLIRIFK